MPLRGFNIRCNYLNSKDIMCLRRFQGVAKKLTVNQLVASSSLARGATLLLKYQYLKGFCRLLNYSVVHQWGTGGALVENNLFQSIKIAVISCYHKAYELSRFQPYICLNMSHVTSINL